MLFSPSSKLDHPRTIKYRPPLRSPMVTRRLLSLPHCACVYLVGWCMLLPIGGCLNPQRILSYLFFCPKIRWPNRLNSVHPHLPRHARYLSQIYLNNTVTIQLVVGSSHPAEAIETHGPIALSIFIFFIAHLIA